MSWRYPGRNAMWLLLLAQSLMSQTMNPRTYDVGSPTLTDIWVDRQAGNDSRTGATRAEALRTITAAWNRIPQGGLTTTGYRIQLVGGHYEENEVPVYWERRHGTFQCPIILSAADGKGTVILPNLNIFDCRYLYLINLHIQAYGGDALHFEQCEHMLVKNTIIQGVGNIHNYEGPQEAFKANQCQYLYVEDCDISGGWDNAVDWVAVQYGHLVDNKIHHGHEWCMYVKGGSAYLRIEANEFYDAITGGFTAGQGTSFEYMVSPWLHYEAYDIKFINNLIHDIEGPGMGINGGYNILLAHNTLYRVGRTSHAIEAVFGLRRCNGNTVQCQQYLTQGGWGTDKLNVEEPIPNANVFIYNNLLYNPSGYSSAWSHFAVYGPRTASNGTNIPSPVRCDVNLQIRGNVIWNGAIDLPLGTEESDRGCQPGNPTCTSEQLRRDNAINTLQPMLINPAQGDFRPVAGSAVFSAQTFAIPAFAGRDRPQKPLSPAGNLENSINRDFSGANRSSSSPPGAYASATQSVAEIPSPEEFQLAQNYPNPFNAQTHIRFFMPMMSLVQIALYDAHGKLTRRLANGNFPPGWNEVVWNGKDSNGEAVPSGVYFINIKANTFRRVIKTLLLR